MPGMASWEDLQRLADLEVSQLAEVIVTSRRTEIETMRTMLDRVEGGQP